MIIIDSSELKSTSRLPSIQGISASPCLESESGADMLISPLSAPAPNKALIQRHIKAGALLVQGKWSFNDLSASLKDGRLTSSLAKMLEISYGIGTCAQRVLLYVGDPLSIGSAEYAAVSKWADRGGRVEQPLLSVYDIPEWAKMKEKHLKEYADHPIKWAYTDSVELNPSPEEDPLQLVVRVAKGDPRYAVAQCPGIGPELANRWWEAMAGQDRRLFRMLAWMSEPQPEMYDMPKIHGYGKGKLAAVREWLGLTGNEVISVMTRR